MTQYAERRRNDNIAESKRMVAEGLESMADSILVQDTAIKGMAAHARAVIDESKFVADKAKADADIATKSAAEAKHQVAVAIRELHEFRDQQTVLQKFQWFFRGPWW